MSRRYCGGGGKDSWALPSNRVTACVRVGSHPHGYQLGDKGVVLRVARPMATRLRYYLVVMDKDGSDATGVLFGEDEIGDDA
jgi:hypothetical protein